MTHAGPVTLLFTDLVNSSELLQRAGDEQAQRIFQAHHKLLKNAIATHGGQEIKWLGDGLMAVFASTADAVRCAIAMQQAARRRVAAERLAIRVGLNVGEALRDEADYFGLSVVIARRLCDYAQGGQILCSALVTGLLAGRQAFSFRECGALALKGVAAPVAASEVLYQHDAPAALLTHTPFVGRLAELRKLTQQLQEACAGHGGLALLAGEPGIGKTRTMEEFAELARERGARVLTGRCYEGEWAPPYGPFAEALAAQAREAPPAELRQDLGLGSAPLARLVPALREKLPDIPEPVALQPDEERFRLLDAAAQFFVALSARAPVVLALDDLHWADKGTIALLRHVARFASRQRILLLGSYRDVEVGRTHPLAEALGAVPRETRYEHIQLTGLETTEVEQLLETIADQAVPAALVSAISSETSGNPFFIREVLLHLVEEGQVFGPEGRWAATLPIDKMGIPESVRQVIGRRLARLSEAANRLLSAAAGFTGAFRFDIAARVAGLDEAQALDAVDESLAAHLLLPGSDPESCDFIHALVRHALYEQLSPPRRVRLHRQIAEAMEHCFGDRVAEHAAEVAEQYHRSAALPGAERGVDHAMVAAERAEAAYAREGAVAALRVALDLIPKDDARRPRLYARLGLALAWILAFAEAQTMALEAARLIAATEGDDEAADYLAEILTPMWEGGFLQGALTVAQQGLRFVHTRRDATWASHRAIEIICREPEAPDSPGIPVDTPERTEIGRLLAQLPVRPNYAWRFLVSDGRWRAEHFLLSGKYRRSVERLRLLANECEAQGRIALAASYWCVASRCLIALGDFEEAQVTRLRGAALVQRAPDSAMHVGALLAVGEDERRMAFDENWNEPLPGLGLRRSDGPPPGWYRASTDAAIARTHARMGRVDRALRRLSSAIPAIERAPGWAENYVRMVYNAAETLWITQRREHIEVIERGLREKIIPLGLYYPMADGRQALARLCALQSRYAEATEWFAKARVVLDEQGARPLRAIADYDEGLMYMRRGADGDRERARPLLDAALAQFRTLGMPGWIRRAENLLHDGKKGVTTNKSSAPSSFAEGRYQVKRLLGEGSKKRVYLAHDTRLDRDVAFALVKTNGLDATELVRVRREVQAMARLGDAPNVVTVYDTGDEGGQPYIISQYMAGGDLARLLEQADNHRLRLDQALRIANDLCEALAHAHQHGLIHRDLKPANVWLSADGHAKLGDFGLAVALDRSRLTVEAMMVGTVAYMPPEQALGQSADARSDLYALGVMLYEMVTGRLPFIGDDVISIIYQHIHTPPVAPSLHNPEVPLPVETLILRLMAKTPDERPQSAAAVREALAASKVHAPSRSSTRTYA